MPRATQQGGAEDSLAGCGLGKKVGSGSFCEVPDLHGLFPSSFPRILCKTQSPAVLQLTLSSNRDLPPATVCAASRLLHVTVRWRATAPALSLPGAQSTASTATVVTHGSLKVFQTLPWWPGSPPCPMDLDLSPPRQSSLIRKRILVSEAASQRVKIVRVTRDQREGQQGN